MIKDRILNMIGFVFVITIFFSSIIHINAGTVSFEEKINVFPDNYKPHLYRLHAKYPNWEFKPLYTKLNFNEAVYAESTNNRSLVPINASEYIKSNVEGDYVTTIDSYVEKDKNWVSTTLPVVRYFMDPVNFLSEKYIFQFEDLTFDESAQNKEGVEAILKGSFMHKQKINYYNLVGDLEETERTYSEAIMEGAITYGINPYYLASKIRQEVGPKGSGSTSGTFLGFEGIYNFYNINAYDSANPVANGLRWAGGGTSYKRPWVSPSLSIVGGAGYINDSFIGKGQYTSYLQRFNVNPNSYYDKYTHQYMTNIAGATSESLNNYKAYLTNMNSKKIFWIPVYENYEEEEINRLEKVGTLKNDVYVRRGAGMSYLKKDKLKKGTKIEIVEGTLFTENYNYTSLIYPYFYKVRYSINNKKEEGYVYVGDVKVDEVITLKVGENYKIKNLNNNSVIQSSNRKSVEIEEDMIKPILKGNSEVRIYHGVNFDVINIKVIE